MANASVKAETAGTSLKTALANMAKPTKQMQAYMDKYGISLTNADGSMKTFREVIDNLRSSLGGLSKTEKTAAATAIFGKESFAGMLAIVNASDADFKKCPMRSTTPQARRSVWRQSNWIIWRAT